VRELGFELVGPVDAHPGALLRAALGEDQLAAVLEAEPERGRLGPFRPGLEEANPTGAHQVDVQDELAVVRGEEEVLATPPSAREVPTVERRERRVERLQRRDVGRPGLGDRRAAHRLVERQPSRLHLGKLGNDSSSWTRSM
jgi:hypothetical protein